MFPVGISRSAVVDNQRAVATKRLVQKIRTFLQDVLVFLQVADRQILRGGSLFSPYLILRQNHFVPKLGAPALVFVRFMVSWQKWRPEDLFHPAIATGHDE